MKLTALILCGMAWIALIFPLRANAESASASSSAAASSTGGVTVSGSCSGSCSVSASATATSNGVTVHREHSLSGPGSFFDHGDWSSLLSERLRELQRSHR